jgi:ATPase subunit of ABC transporter with duplicated ATPase domains
VIRLNEICHQYGRQILFLEASAAINRGEKIGLVGPNGAGKSTIFRMITGAEEPDAGQVVIDRDVTIGYFSQDVGEMQGRTVVEETLFGAGVVARVAHELHGLEAAMADPARADELDAVLERYGEVQARFFELGGYALESKAREILAGLGFASEVMDTDVGSLSGGWKMRVALARILLTHPDVMLLDEPSNHLDLASLIWLETFLKGFPGALLMTSHDREFMNRIVGRVIEIDDGNLTSYSGNYDFYEAQRAILAQQAEAQFARQEAMLAKERRFIERFKAQAAKAAQVQSRIKKLDKIDRAEPPKHRHTLQFEFAPVSRSGDEVLKIDAISKAYGERRVYDGFSFLIRRQERWCVMGINGAGKSTLLKMAAGETDPDTGTVLLGASVKLGYFAQHSMELLQPSQSVFDTLVSAFPKTSTGTLRSLAGAFGFSGDEIDKPCASLSGGEKVRLVMARLLYAAPNFLVLDEPTNHLDMATKDMLITALRDFEGTMLFVSHDRHFLSALSNRVLELSPEGAHPYPAGYTEYVARSGHEAPGLPH